PHSSAWRARSRVWRSDSAALPPSATGDKSSIENGIIPEAWGAPRPYSSPAAKTQRGFRRPAIDSVCIFMQDACNFMQTPSLTAADLDANGADGRRAALARIIRENAVGRQSELVSLLRKRGHVATQSSISRD